ncbi:MAG: hypothetical protein ACKO6E_05000, partial [Planctomycetota bacterium]
MRSSSSVDQFVALFGEQASSIEADRLMSPAGPTAGTEVPAGEEVLSIEDLASRFNVSTKTISRWRDHGLVARRFDVGGRRR